MEKLNGEPLKAFGPEWLSSKDNHFLPQDEDSSRSNKQPTRNTPPPSKKIPLKFTRSKTLPLLPIEEQNESVEEDESVKERRSGDAFTMLKERNSFDKNFPSLKPMGNLKPQNGASKEGHHVSWGGAVWKNLSTPSPPLTNQTPESSSPPIEKDIELASKLIPTIQAPKVLAKNKVELLEPKKLHPKRKFDATTLRKATSDPNLPIPAAYQENYAKLMASRKVDPKVPEKPKDVKPVDNKSKPSTNFLVSRDEFFKNKGGLHRRTSSNGSSSDESSQKETRSESPQGQTQVSVSTQPPNRVEEKVSNVVHITPTSSTNEKQTIQSLTEAQECVSKLRGALGTNENRVVPAVKFQSEKDEEKFLRDLGWLPEEEDPVPELTEEEILEESNKLVKCLVNHVTDKKKHTLDVSLKRWQHERERLYVAQIINAK